MTFQDDLADYHAAAGKAAWMVPDIDAGTPRREVTTIGIIGAGTMGGGISMNFATAGYRVKIVETTREALDRGLAVVRDNYRRSAGRGRFPHEEVDIRMARYDACASLADLADCDLVIEAVFEDMDLKRRIFTDLDRIMKPGAILATNTSALNIDRIADMTNRPQDVIGLHFFSPANVMKLLEIVRAERTAQDVLATCLDLTREIGKIAVVVGVCDGFVGNRILFKRQDQAMKLVYRGIMPWEVDAALNAFGFRMGPFQLVDLAGLDIGWSRGATTADPIRDALCEMDRRGQKTRAGYYDYDDNRVGQPSDVTAKIIADITGAEPSHMAQNDIIDLCICPMINEAVKILEENKAQRPSDVDVVWINGYGWPSDKGGPIYYGDMIGADKVLRVMEKLGAEDPAFAPAETLRELAAKGGKFTEIDTGGLKTARE